MSCGGSEMSFQAYMFAQEEKRRWNAEYNNSCAHLDLAQIRERLAEIKSQYDPIVGLLETSLSERDRLYVIAFYVVVGRFPGVKP